MKIKDFTFTAFLLAISMAVTGCGGGGGADGARPAQWPITPMAVQMRTSAQPPNFVASDVAPALNDLAAEADTRLQSRLRDTGPSTPARFWSPLCPGMRCITTIDGVPFIRNTSNADYAAYRFQPVAIRRDIPFAQGRTREVLFGETIDYYIYGGWLDNSAFGLETGRFVSGELAGRMFVYGTSFGRSFRTNPAGSGRAAWNGVMVGRDISATSTQGNIIQGDATIDIDDQATPDVDVEFTNIVDLNTGTSRNDMTWEDIALTSGGFETGSDGDSIEGRFYGSGHEEVGGVFERDSILGAFGAER